MTTNRAEGIDTCNKDSWSLKKMKEPDPDKVSHYTAVTRFQDRRSNSRICRYRRFFCSSSGATATEASLILLAIASAAKAAAWGSNAVGLFLIYQND